MEGNNFENEAPVHLDFRRKVESEEVYIALPLLFGW